MLEDLELLNVGPAPRMKAEFAPRVTLITGDNGLGKSFLLDCAWWVVTRRWPAEVNRRMTSSLEARPRDMKRQACINVRVADAGNPRGQTLSEIDEVSGGPGPLVAFAAGVGAGLVANWIWDAWGEEISEAGEAVYDTLCGH